MNRREFLGKLARLSVVASGVVLLGSSSRCRTQDDHQDVYPDYEDGIDPINPGDDDWYCDAPGPCGPPPP